MDLRAQRTRRSIINAFIELRALKPLEKITVKELSERALITKRRSISTLRIYTTCPDSWRMKR